MTNFRAMCAELLEWAERTSSHYYKQADVIVRARALLAQPEPEVPTDEEIMELMPQEMRDDLAAVARGPSPGWILPPQRQGLIRVILNRHVVDHARAVLAKWGHPTPQLVVVSERLPEPGEWVWHCYAGVRLWQHGRYNGRQFFIGNGPESHPATHWLPANALPTPEATVHD
jgi:hypothetical protein